MPLQRSAIRTLWDDSYTSAKTERPNLVSAIRLPHVEASKAVQACAVEVALEVQALAGLQGPAEVDGRFMLPTFVARPFSHSAFEVPADSNV